MSDPIIADPPEQADRPVPLVAVPEGTSEPTAWSTPGTAPLDPPDGGDDEVRAERHAAERADRRERAAGDGGAEPVGSTRESEYSTEATQGAAQPGPEPLREEGA